MSTMEPSVDDMTNRSPHYFNTYLHSIKFRYTWTIHDFRHFVSRSDGSDLKTPNFQTSHNMTIINWYFRLQRLVVPQGTNDICLTLTGKVSGACELSVTFKFSVLNENREHSINFVESIEGEYNPKEIFSLADPGTYIARGENLIAKNSGFCPDNKLTILCDVTVQKVEFCVTFGEPYIKDQIPECQLVDDISALFGDRYFCDVKLMVNGKNFHAHKNILAARCSVFATMFKQEMTGNINNTIEINDIDHEVFEEVLRYIYTGETSTLTDEIAMKLLVAADKYKLNRLKIICKVFIDKDLTTDNVTNILIFADANSMTLLKQKALKFMTANMKDVIKTNGYKSMVKSHPNLIRECCIAMTQKIDQMGLNT